MSNDNQIRPGFDIAVIGMAGRFPGADHLGQYWENLKDGVESIHFFSDDELLEAGIDPQLIQNPNYVKAKGILEGIEYFDASFFGYSPTEARIMDPQSRLFHECTWAALENAGYDSQVFPGLIGLYAGGSPNFPWELMSFQWGAQESFDTFTLAMRNNKDLLSTQISYNFNLKGPSISLYTACSTSLVAIHEACQGLLSGDCDMAIAGGVSIELPNKAGYIYQEGLIKSADGHCRAFDREATGTVYGSGVGTVILKRVEDAIQDRDHIYAVIKGSAINNDGRRKIGYTAPSIDGQAEVIRTAHLMADVEPESISYIETHGTGTNIGDPIEIEGLKAAFATEKKSICAIGSVKPNIGHLDAAAGVASFIKAVLILNNRQIPPLLHFNDLNPKLDMVDSPFYINDDLTALEQGVGPLRVGVSSFGLGGTNCHIVIQEPPKQEKSLSSRPWQMVLLSARSETALTEMTQNLSHHIQVQPEIALADLAYTLQTGRREFKYRKPLVCRDLDDLIHKLEEPGSDFPVTICENDRPEVIYLCSDQQVWSENFGLELYQTEAGFREEMDYCFNLLMPYLGMNVKSILYPVVGQAEQSVKPGISKIIDFILKYSFAKLLMSWGINFHSIIGKGTGEYLGAVLAGMISVEDTLKIMAVEAKATDSFQLQRLLKGIQINQPRVPFLSGTTGSEILEATLRNPSFWLEGGEVNLAQTAMAIEKLTEKPGSILIGLGHAEEAEQLAQVVDFAIWKNFVQLIQPVSDSDHPYQYFMKKVATLWGLGVKVDWEAFYQNEERFKVPLPAYPFERQYFWVDGDLNTLLNPNQENLAPAYQQELVKQEFGEWFYQPTWESTVLDEGEESKTNAKYLIFADQIGLADGLIDRLNFQGAQVTTVQMGNVWAQPGEREYVLDPTNQEEYLALFTDLKSSGQFPTNILHFWSAGNEISDDQAMERGFYSLIHIAQAVSKQNIFDPLQLTYITNDMHHVTGDEQIQPGKMVGQAVCKVLPQEYPNIFCKTIDVSLPIDDSARQILVQQLVQEIQDPTAGLVIAYRGEERLQLTYRQFERDRLELALTQEPNEPAPILKKHGVYLITGGLGGVGLNFAEYLARSVQAKLVLLGRSIFPPRQNWEHWSQEHPKDDATSVKIQRVMELEALGAEVMILSADVADYQQMAEVFKTVEVKYGTLHGVIHGAGVVRVKSGQTAVENIQMADCAEQFRPKVEGVRVLHDLLQTRSVDFCLLISSLAPILGGLGHVAYAAANLYMDAFVEQLTTAGCTNWFSINWAEWQYTGPVIQKYSLGESLEKLELLPDEGVRTFQCILTLQESRVVISTGDLNERLAQWITQVGDGAEIDDLTGGRAESYLDYAYGAYQSPQDKYENVITGIWKQFYGVGSVSTEDNFFDLGATSLDFIHIISKLGKALQRHIPIETMFEYPTIKELASYLAIGEEVVEEEIEETEEQEIHQIATPVTGIAVIGMAGRFPGAANIDEFWTNLMNGEESITFFSDEELIDAGVEPADLQNPNYVKAKGYLADVEYFDADFFNYTSRDAEIMDPQMRLFHECVWEALENAGYVPDQYAGQIGLFAGATPNLYWEVLAQLSRKHDSAGQFEAALFYDKDSLTNQISYKLNLKGPSMNIFTGCSTSLVAIDAACQALRSGQCDMALAGGVTVSLPTKAGYMYQEGMVSSKDGHCRSFDADASGVVFGDGAATVVLKPLEQALADGDTVYAVIKGSAINNDGNRKVGYTSPSIRGQADVIKAAQRAANVKPEEITYVEAHGTATRLGDPIEIKALKQAFNTSKKNYCGIGTVKSNFGHIMSASGAAGFIKTVLALKHRVIPPSLHFNKANPEIDFENSPFYVNHQLTEWQEGDTPRRAGVNSLAIGGTNAHVILEELPEQRSSTRKRHWKMLLLSARTETALDQMTSNLAAFLKAHPKTNICDVAYTLQVGRKKFKHCRTVICEELEDAIESLTTPTATNVRTIHASETKNKVVFMFAGQGSQYINMAQEIYIQEPIFREEIDRSSKIIQKEMGLDLRKILFPKEDLAEAEKQINQTEITQIVLFVVECALAKLLMHWGIRPAAMIGYSFGEYAAAHISGVLSLEDALKLIITRGRLMQQLPQGAMLSVPVDEAQLNQLITEFTAEHGTEYVIYPAIINGPSCIVAGLEEAVGAFETYLKRKRYLSMRIMIAQAVHSPIMEQIAEDFRACLRDVTLNPPIIPYISGITGSWIGADQATDPEYWIKHMSQTIKFAAGIQELVQEEDSIFVEIGPGRDLSVLMNRFIDGNPQRMINTLRNPKDDLSDIYYLLSKVAHLWAWGTKIDWENFYMDEKRLRIGLPTYPFERKYYWIEGKPFDMLASEEGAKGSTGRKEKMADWFYVPSWKRSALSTTKTQAALLESERKYLILSNGGVMVEEIVTKLKQQGHQIVIVQIGEMFKELGINHYAVNPEVRVDYETLVTKLLELEFLPDTVLHFWNVDEQSSSATDSPFTDHHTGFYSLLYLVQALSTEKADHKLEMIVMTNNMQDVCGEGVLHPEKATVLGACITIPQEYVNITCRVVDLDLQPGKDITRLAQTLLKEFHCPTEERLVAYRNQYRWVQTFEPMPLAEPNQEDLMLRRRGVYLITGGLGGIGLVLAEYLAEEYQAKLILLGRTALPPRNEWVNWLADHSEEDAISRKLLAVQRMEHAGAQVVVVSSDIADYQQVKSVIEQAEIQLGQINGIIHSAGIAGGGMIQLKRSEAAEEVFAPKVQGTLVIDQLLETREVDFLLLCSSLNAVVGGFGQVDYNAANNFLDAYAYYKTYRDGLNTISLNWYGWKEVGMFVQAVENLAGQVDISQQDALTCAEGIEIFRRSLSGDSPQILVAPRDLSTLMQEAQLTGQMDSQLDDGLEENQVPLEKLHQRPELDTPYVAPETSLELELEQLIGRLLGINRVGVNDNFFELGGDSLKAISLLTRIRKKLNVEIPLTHFFQIPTIKLLSKEMALENLTYYQSIEPAVAKPYYVISSAQKRLYILQQIDPASVVYNEFEAVLIEGELDLARLEESFRKMIQRHEILRTSFAVVNNEPMQQIHPAVDFAFEIFQGEEAQAQEIVQNFIRPFDLSNAPLFRAGIVNLSEERVILLIDMHHIITDGVSDNIFIKELMTFYRGEELPAVGIQYKDFAEWQSSEEQKESIREQAEYWLGEYKDHLPVLDLPTDFPRPAVQASGGDLVDYIIDQQLTARIKGLAQEGVTLYMILMAAYNILLQKYTGQSDICVGSPITGRSHSDVQNTLGMFVNMLAIRNYPENWKTFDQFLDEVKEQTLKAFENQDYPYDELVAQLGLQGDLSRNPLFSVSFALQSMGREKMELDQMLVSPYETGVKKARFDLLIRAEESDGQIHMALDYATALFKRQTAEEFIERYVEVLRQVTEEPQISLGEIQIINDYGDLEASGALEDMQEEFDF